MTRDRTQAFGRKEGRSDLFRETPYSSKGLFREMAYSRKGLFRETAYSGQGSSGGGLVGRRPILPQLSC
eukprot:COSAG03_NODE_4733_length_1451_cov_1.798077_2_plen_68_part_01